jgi:penicillin-binding protein 1A
MTDKYQTREDRRKLEQPIKKGKKRRKPGFVKKILIAIIIIGMSALLFGSTLFAYYASSAPKIVEDQLKDPISSEIYDMNGKLVTKVGVENRDYVEYEKIPKIVKDAVLATEDNRFFEHPGIDLIRLGGAVISNLTDGFGSQGASTLTQQVIKNQFLTPEKTPKRKAQEAWLAYQLEQKYSKEEIFEMYVNNVVDYDDGIHGIATAAQYYYGKNLDQLELHEAAMLAGIPQRPRAHNPFRNPDLAEDRRNTVLKLMNMHGKISKDEMEAAQKIPVESTIKKVEDRVSIGQKYDSYIDVVIEEVEAMGEYNIFTDGLKIYTNIDQDAQEHVEKVLSGQASVQFPDEELQAGITLLDTKTGAIRAIGSGRNQEVKRGFNYATDTRRQPGSTIKPILDFGPAIEYLGWSTYEQLLDEAYTYTGGTPINNWDNKYMGQMSMRKALYLSRNIPALKAIQKVGLEQADKFATGLGFDFKNVYESYAIGGLGGEDKGVSPLHMAGAYAAFGNEGIYNEPHTVTKIVLRDGETEVTRKVESHVAMKDSTAFMVTDMLKDVLTKGTGTNAKVSGLPAVAGKTGTTNYDKETRQKFKLTSSDVPDAWFTGYTTNYTISVWTGYSNQSVPVKFKDQKIAQHIFRDIMGTISKGIATPDFKQPKSVVEAAVEIGTIPAMIPSESTPQDQITHELFIRGKEPKEISKKYEKLEAPKALTGAYKEESNEITLTWEFSSTEDVQFEVSEVDGNATKQVLFTIKERVITIANPQPGVEHTFQVVTISGDRRSEPAEVKVQVESIDPLTDNVD